MHVNPNDIENISVLKDWFPRSIYGARAAYGVILVTTKKRKRKARCVPTIREPWDGLHLPVSPDMVNSLDFVKFWNDGVNNAGAPGRAYSPEKIAQLEQYVRNPSSIDPWGDLAAIVECCF